MTPSLENSSPNINILRLFIILNKPMSIFFLVAPQGQIGPISIIIRPIIIHIATIRSYSVKAI